MIKEFGKAFLSFGVATSVEKLIGFVLLPLYTYHLTTSEYGIIDMCGVLLSIFSIFGLLQLETSLQRYYYDYSGKRKNLFVSNIYFSIGLFSCFVAIIVACLSPFISQWLFNSKGYYIPIIIVAIQIPLININILGLVILRFERKNLQFLYAILLKVSIMLLSVYLFVVVLNLKIFGILMAQLLSLLVATLLVTYYVKELLVLRQSKIIRQRNYKYAFPQIPARIGSVALAQANRFFILSFLSISAVGVFSVSFRLASTIEIVNTAFIMAWAPFMHKQFNNPGNKKVFATVLPIVTAVVFTFVIMISLFSVDIVKLLLSKDYSESYRYVGGLALFFGLYIIKECVDIGPKIKEKTKFLSYNFLITTLINFILLFVFVNIWGLAGVVLGMIFTNIVLVIISWYVSNRLYYIPHNIITFISLLIPSFVISVSVMFYEFSFVVRALVGTLVLLIMTWFVYRAFRILKQNVTL